MSRKLHGSSGRTSCREAANLNLSTTKEVEIQNVRETHDKKDQPPLSQKPSPSLSHHSKPSTFIEHDSKKRQCQIDGPGSKIEEQPESTSGRPQRKQNCPDRNCDFDRTRDLELQKSDKRKGKHAKLRIELDSSSQKAHRTLHDIQERADKTGLEDESSKESPNEDADDLYFAGIAGSGPNQKIAPTTLKEALTGKDTSHWERALEDEL
ncbi:hypothetical protein K439DRAFT_1624210 [Ramaria rubella]|nr:hypothetical protein K439DRAFT_1624210 [Ramaria rubella]